MPPTVSILVPCYNAAPWIGAALESALAQTWPDREIIVVDDGSTDESVAILDVFASRGVKVVRQSNRGASAARNRALEESVGDLVQFLDADDLLGPDKIATQIEALTSRGRGSDAKVASCAWGRFSGSPADAVVSPDRIWCDQSGIDFLVACARENLMFPSCAWLIPRRLCQAAGRWDETLSMNDDGEYMARVLAASGGIVFCDAARAYYRDANPLSYSARRTTESAESDLRAWDAIVEVMMRLEQGERVARAAATGYQRLQIRYATEFPAVVAAARRKERAFGGGEIQIGGNGILRVTSRLFGWRAAMRLHRAVIRARSRLKKS